MTKIEGGWYLGNRVARGYGFVAKWACHLASTALGIQEFYLSKEVAPYLALPSQCTISISHHFDLLLCIDSHMILVNIFKKVWPISLPPISFAYRTVYCKFLVTYSPIGMFIRLLRWPKLHVLLVDMLAQMKMDFATKQNQNKITWVDFKFFTNGVVNFTPFFLIGISLCLEYFHFV